MRQRATGARGRVRGDAIAPRLPAPETALSLVEEEHAIDVLMAVARLTDAQLAALLGSRRAAELRAIERDFLNRVADSAR